MLNFVTYLLLAVAASSAKDYVCLLEDPNPNHCDSFCVNTLKPLLHQISRRQEQGINCDNAELQDNLDRLEVKMETQMQDVERQLNALEQSLQTVQIGLVGEIKAVLTKMETQQQEILRFMNSPKPADELKPKKKVVPPNFEQIGSRYLRFVKEAVNYSTAEEKCLKMGGHLANFRNREELTDIYSKISNSRYWVGSLSRTMNPNSDPDDSEPRPVSVRPRFYIRQCKSLRGTLLFGTICDHSKYFICEADNET